MSTSTKITLKRPSANKPVFRKQVNNKNSSNKQNSPAQEILNLHQTIGNQAVQRLFESGFIQGKLTVGEPNDKYEQEADRVADEVMRMPEPQVQRQSEEDEEEEMIQTKPIGDQITPLVQRQVEEEEEEIQAKAEGQTPQVTPNLESEINALQGGGHSLSKETRNFFEPRFGQDFSSVRVHTDSNANQLARSINAKAFTKGKDVVFGAGEYKPESSSGKRLLGHELTHVLQQETKTILDQDIIVQRQIEGEREEIKRKEGGAETIEEHAKRLYLDLKQDGIYLDLKKIEEELKRTKQIEEKTEVQEKQWSRFEIGLQRDFFQVTELHFRAAEFGIRRAIEGIFKGIDELAELETLRLQSIFSPVRMMPGIKGVGIGGYIGKQIDTIIQVTIRMEKKQTIEKLKSKLTTEIENNLLHTFNPKNKEYKEIMANVLLDAKLHWIANLLYLHKGEYEINDPRYAHELRKYLIDKYPAADSNKWRDSFMNTYGLKFYQIFKEKKLL